LYSIQYKIINESECLFIKYKNILYVVLSLFQYKFSLDFYIILKKNEKYNLWIFLWISYKFQYLYEFDWNTNIN
jgi:hypothetical protein